MRRKDPDSTLLICTIVLSFIGFLALANASAPLGLASFSDKFYFVKQQALWLIVGFSALFLTSRIPYRFWESIATPAFFISLCLLALVLVPGIGTKTYGAQRWITVGSLSIQPSEFIKLTLAFYFAKIAERGRGALSYFLPLAAVFGLIIAEPDLGTGIVVTLAALSQIFASGVNIFAFFGALVVGGVSAAIAIVLSDYRRERLLTYLSITKDPLGSDYHIRQILLALGAGGLFGVGLGEGKQRHLFLPEAATDSIFATVAEEVGFVGVAAIIIVFLVFVLRGMSIAAGAPDKFSQVLAVGITSWISYQVFINVASVSATIPLTGVPLPFFSYGGSSQVMILSGIGILLSISRHAKKKV